MSWRHRPHRYVQHRARCETPPTPVENGLAAIGTRTVDAALRGEPTGMMLKDERLGNCLRGTDERRHASSRNAAKAFTPPRRLHNSDASYKFRFSTYDDPPRTLRVTRANPVANGCHVTTRKGATTHVPSAGLARRARRVRCGSSGGETKYIFRKPYGRSACLVAAPRRWGEGIWEGLRVQTSSCARALEMLGSLHDGPQPTLRATPAYPKPRTCHVTKHPSRRCLSPQGHVTLV